MEDGHRIGNSFFCQNLAADRLFGKLLYRETESHIDEGHMT